MNLNSSGKKKGNDCIMTPKWVAEDMINHFSPVGKILEPCRGDGVFTDLLSTASWCEINEGKDFFSWNQKVDWIISNPPFSNMRKFILHSFKIADEIVYLVPVWKIYLSYGLVKETLKFGGIKEIRWYGTGGSLGFPMGNGIGAVHWSRNHNGTISQSFWKNPLKQEDLRENEK